MGPKEILVIAIVVLVLFGAPRLPKVAKSLGQSLRILKDETTALTETKPDAESEKPAIQDEAAA